MELEHDVLSILGSEMPVTGSRKQ